MTVKIEYPNGKSEIIHNIVRIDSAGLLKRRAHGIDINKMVIERKHGGVGCVYFSDIQHFEIVA